MSSRDYIKHLVSNTSPVGTRAGDEYYDPGSNLLYKTLVVNGNSVTTGKVLVDVGSGINSITIGANTPAPATFTTAVANTVGANTSVYSNRVGLYANTTTTTSAVYQVYNPATQTIDTIFG
jgi:precorrin-6B methylase 2